MKKAPTSKPGLVGGVHSTAGLLGGNLLLHQLQDLIVARFDAKVDPGAAGILHLQGCGVINAIDPTQTLPMKLQAPCA